ncbi:uncharacterized protein LOC143212913 [Lasioglossum baleicum]|uniref:uncharacterized protein LOC143212913 n=1 Tax=Lasioglossum baleicum TaxID=434251 RepID=UPI003FCC5B35
MAGVDTHYKFSIRLMTILGLWPYVNVNYRRITPLMHDDADMFLVLQCMSLIIMAMGSIVKFNTFLFVANTVRLVMEDVRSKWNTTHKDTLEILEKRAILGKQQGAIYAIFIYPSALLLVVFRTSSYILLVTASPDSNLTDPFPVVTDYMIDEEKYFFLIIMHQNVTFFFVATIYVASETLFIMWLQHGIGLFELASYHIEKGVCDRPSHISRKFVDAYRKQCFANAVTYHNEAKTFLMSLKDTLSFSYAVLLVFAVGSLAINFFRLSTAICETHDIEEMILSFLFSMSELVYMFYLNYVVQQILDYSDDLPRIM